MAVHPRSCFSFAIKDEKILSFVQYIQPVVRCKTQILVLVFKYMRYTIGRQTIAVHLIMLVGNKASSVSVVPAQSPVDRSYPERLVRIFKYARYLVGLERIGRWVRYLTRL